MIVYHYIVYLIFFVNMQPVDEIKHLTDKVLVHFGVLCLIYLCMLI